MIYKKNDFWNAHSRQFLEMAFNQEHRNIPAVPDGYGKRTGDCGDTVEIFLTIKDDRISVVSFDTDGCMHTAACCNTVAHLVEGKRIEEAWQISPEDIAGFLETLPPDHYHCAELAVGALYLALNDSRQLKREPWKKAYGSRR